MANETRGAGSFCCCFILMTGSSAVIVTGLSWLRTCALFCDMFLKKIMKVTIFKLKRVFSENVRKAFLLH
jgi:hypothetical protein